MKIETMEPKTKVSEMNRSRIVSKAEWEAARQQLLMKEKELTRARDALAAERRRMPWLAVEKDYEFDGPNGKASLLDLFDGRRQLARTCMRRLLHDGRPRWQPCARERARYHTRVRVARASEGHQTFKGADGLGAHSLVHHHGRLRQRLRG